MPRQGKTVARGYGYTHKKRRAQLKYLVAAGKATGWRYWWLRTKDGRLFSPHGIPAAGAPFGERSLVPWDKADYVPVCPENRDHVPPEPNCLCGVYFSPYLLDVMGLAQVLRLAVEESQTPLNGNILALGRFSFTEPVIYQRDRGGMFEGRAAAATLEHLWVFPEWLPAGREARRNVTNKIKGRYRIPIEIGRPSYTTADAHDPDALTIEQDRLRRDGR